MTQMNKQLSVADSKRCCKRLDTTMSAAFFAALSDPTRLAILVRLSGFARPATVSEISCCYPIDMSVVSRHLTALKAAGILESEKRGKQVYYSVRYDTFTETLRSVADAVENCCPDGRCC